MLKIEEAQEIIEKYINLKNEAINNPKVKSQLKKQEQLCIEKFSYIIYMKTNRYKKFFNYDDLNQEGFVALIKAMNNYDPKKGSFFWWAHKYIDTRISRQANQHTTIRYPLRIAKDITPHKENNVSSNSVRMGINSNSPDKELEKMQLSKALYDTLPILTKEQQEIINMKFGLQENKPMSINCICQKLQINRNDCINTLRQIKSIIKNNIKL